MRAHEIKLRRLANRLDGRSYIVDFEIGSTLGRFGACLERDLFLEVLKGEPDAVVLDEEGSREYSRHLEGRRKPSLIVCVDWLKPVRIQQGGSVCLDADAFAKLSVREAFSLGAESVSIPCPAEGMLDFKRIELEHAEAIILECSTLGIPLIADVFTQESGFAMETVKRSIFNTSERLLSLGAAAVRVPFLDIQFTRSLVRNLESPVWMNFPAREGTPLQLDTMKALFGAGILGVVFSWSYFRAGSAGLISRKIRRAIHCDGHLTI